MTTFEGMEAKDGVYSARRLVIIRETDHDYYDAYAGNSNWNSLTWYGYCPGGMRVYRTMSEAYATIDTYLENEPYFVVAALWDELAWCWYVPRNQTPFIPFHAWYE